MSHTRGGKIITLFFFDTGEKSDENRLLLDSGHGVLNQGDARILQVDKPRMTISSNTNSKPFRVIKYDHD
jgi:hypothetical protein